MKINDCKVGMRVIRTGKDTEKIRKGKEYTISEFFDDCIEVEQLKNLFYSPENFEPINKFKIDEEVIYKNTKAIIWGLQYNPDINIQEYAIQIKEGFSKGSSTIVPEPYLDKLKKKDELEVGDKVIPRYNTKVKAKILYKTYDEYIKGVKYLIEQDDGFIRLIMDWEILKIIYGDDE